jgi:hypothetical protein
MKIIILSLIVLFFVLMNYNVKAQDDDYNIISYYAVGNSLDGQPMIDMPNKLRFFPVFVYKDNTEYVKITLYYGSKSRIYKKDADKKDNGHYWDANLPAFYLGDAIQRLEVETKINLDSTYKYNDRDSIKLLKKEIIKQMKSDFVKNDIAGPDITESDIIFDEKLTSVRILYRNYKKTLRQLPALDPAESMGIFRVRYIPFPITGKKMWRPLQQNSIAVFEFGIGFGDVRLSGDDFVKPTLSFDRLGVAFAISNELFSDSARIVALALTYDFNAYGSIGVGANFRDPEGESDVQPYFSFGINKKAFEFLVGQLAGLLGIKK